MKEEGRRKKTQENIKPSTLNLQPIYEESIRGSLFTNFDLDERKILNSIITNVTVRNGNSQNHSKNPVQKPVWLAFAFFSRNSRGNDSRV